MKRDGTLWKKCSEMEQPYKRWHLRFPDIPHENIDNLIYNPSSEGRGRRGQAPLVAARQAPGRRRRRCSDTVTWLRLPHECFALTLFTFASHKHYYLSLLLYNSVRRKCRVHRRRLCFLQFVHIIINPLYNTSHYWARDSSKERF